MRQYLVVANRTLGGPELIATMAEMRAEAGPCRFHFLVPREPAGGSGLASPVVELGTRRADLQGTQQIAAARLNAELARIRDAGGVATGEIGPSKPIVGVLSVLRRLHVDAIVLSTLPLGVSRWLRMDLPSRLRRRVGVPIVHVISEAGPEVDSFATDTHDSHEKIVPPVDVWVSEVRSERIIGPVEVLAVVGNESDAILMRSALERSSEDVVVRIVRDSAEALACLEPAESALDTPRPHLLLLDLQPSIEDSFELLEALHQDDEHVTGDMALVVLSASTRAEDWSRAYELGADAFVGKPPRFDELVDTLDDLIMELSYQGTVRSVVLDPPPVAT